MTNAKNMSGDYFFDKIYQLLENNISQDEIAKIFTEDFNTALNNYEKKQEERQKKANIEAAAADLADAWNCLVDELIEPKRKSNWRPLTPEQAVETVRAALDASKFVDSLFDPDLTANDFLKKIQQWLSEDDPN